MYIIWRSVEKSHFCRRVQLIVLFCLFLFIFLLIEHTLARTHKGEEEKKI